LEETGKTTFTTNKTMKKNFITLYGPIKFILKTPPDY